VGIRIIHAHGASHIGRRDENQDRFVVNRKARLFAVADGMGGHEGGSVASTLAIDTVSHFYDRSDPESSTESAIVREARMDMAFRMAHREVVKHRLGELAEMGTTLVALRFETNDTATLAHVGDSRAYRLRRGRLTQLTRDHSLVADLELELGGSLKQYPDVLRYSHVLTRAIGVGTAGHDLYTIDLEPGDVFLLATDGLHGVVTPERIADVLGEAPHELAAAALVSEAWTSEAMDNITALVVHVD
jgi:serine/threonine protein phosphatase PrpC